MCLSQKHTQCFMPNTLAITFCISLPCECAACRLRRTSENFVRTCLSAGVYDEERVHAFAWSSTPGNTFFCQDAQIKRHTVLLCCQGTGLNSTDVVSVSQSVITYWAAHIATRRRNKRNLPKKHSHSCQPIKNPDRQSLKPALRACRRCRRRHRPNSNSCAACAENDAGDTFVCHNC